MTRGSQELLAFNRGRISRKALARLDVKRTSMSAETMTNWMPSELGGMSLRPGLGHIGQIASTSCRLIPFIFSTTDVAAIEVTPYALRFWVDDELIETPDVVPTITNSSFLTNLTGWTDADEAGGTSAWVTGGYMGLTGNGTNAAIRYQQVTVANPNVEHRLAIEVTRGPVTLRIGSTATADDFFSETQFGDGTHSIAFTPTGDFYLQFSSREKYQSLLSYVTTYTASIPLTLFIPWGTDAELDALRWAQSGDVIFITGADRQQYRIERRANNSWSAIKYEPLDGPFRVENTSSLTLTASDLTGAVTLTASREMFQQEHVGALFSLNSIGQTVTAALVAENTFSNSIRVVGVGSAGRRFGVVVTGTFTATINVQRSFDNLTWADIGSPFVLTGPVNTTYYDELENQIIWYRIGIKTGDYTSGTANVTLTISSGSIRGVVRVTDFTDATEVDAVVLSDLGGTTATDRWAEGAWSDYRGWPSAVAFHDGRLWWAGKDKIWGSVTDSFESFDPDYEGDAAPIARSIGAGPVDTINWLLSLDRLMAGTAGGEVSFRSSSFDEPLTPTNFTPKESGTQGSAGVAAIKVDNNGVFIQRCGRRLYQLAYDIAQSNYVLDDLSAFVPEIGSPGFVRVVVQRQPDTRIHCVRSDGTVAMLLFNKAENILCWVDVETDGEVQDVCVLPGTEEDAVYYAVSRTVNGATTARLERFALVSETAGAAVTKLADAFVYAAGSSATLSGLDHLEGETVVLWGNGKDQGTAVVSSGIVTFPEACTHRCAGLYYRARFKSSKLAYMAAPGKSALGAKKRIHRLGVVLCDTHAQGLKYGRDFDNMDDLPLMEQWAEVDGDSIHDDYEEPTFAFPGEWTTDARLCLEAEAPKPCTVLAAVIDMEANAK